MYQLKSWIKFTAYDQKPITARTELADSGVILVYTSLEANGKWTEYTSVIEVKNEMLDAGIYLDAYARTSLQVDDITFVKRYSTTASPRPSFPCSMTIETSKYQVRPLCTKAPTPYAVKSVSTLGAD